MSHPEMTLAAKILIAMGPPCYRSHQRLWGVIVPKVVNLTLQYGNIPQVSYSHPAFAGLLCWVADDFPLAKQFSELATDLMTHVFTSPSDRSVYALMTGSSVRHWFQGLERGSEDYAEACEFGLQSGNLQYSSYAYGHNMYCRFYQGAPLGDLIRETRSSLSFSQSRHNQWGISLFEGALRIFAHLVGTERDGDGASWETSYLRKLGEHHDIQVCCIYKIMHTFSLLVMGRLEEAWNMSEEVESILYTVGTQGLLPWPEHVFARLLILTALEPSKEEGRQAKRRAEIARILERLRVWATQCPENFEHKYKLAAAEAARIDQRHAEALVLYEQGIAAAGSRGFLQWEGIASERAARFWRVSNGELARTYLQHAYHCFQRWGAVAKLEAMEAECIQSVVDRMPPRLDPNNPLEALMRRDICRRQAQSLSAQTTQAAAVQMSGRLEKQAEELARATVTLRAEVAERKMVQDALAESERRYSRLIDTASEGVWSVDERLRTTFVNARMAELLGHSESEMLGQPVAAFLFEEDLQDLEERAARWRRGESEIYERRYRLKNGDAIWTITSAAPLMSPQGQFQGGFAMVSDISGLKQKEEELLNARAAAESAARLRARFLDIAAHELRTPLSAFSLLLELTQIQLEQHGRPVEMSTVQRLRRQADRLSRLVADLLDVSRLERGALSLRCEPTDVVHLTAECLEDFRLRAPRRPLSFFKPEGPVESSLDPARIHQVLSNLLDNAIKYTPDATPIEVTVEQAGHRLRVSVRDFGEGICEELQRELFSPFARGASPQEGRFGGMGLGLYICRSIVELHGGTIGVSSKEGAGSTFSFELPVGSVG
jgi:PAS domain S-box-containing protein